MASIKPHKDGYRAHVYVKGARDSKVFRTKREASAWASARETELREHAALPAAGKHTLAQALRKYQEEVTPHKRGRRWEEVRIEKFLRDPHLPTAEKIGAVTPAMIGQWRDKALEKVGPSTVLRELVLLSAVFEAARREWQWIPVNPIRDVRKPTQPDHRFVLITWRQVRAMLRVMNYRGGPCRSVTNAVAIVFLVALRTGMRAGELCGLTWSRVMPGHCELPVTKTRPREVPLTPKAQRLIEMMRGFDADLVFGLKPASLDAMFRKYRQRAGLEGFTFHDARHTAATMIAPKLHVLDLCRMFGWSNPAQAMTYYNASAADIAKLLSPRLPVRTPRDDPAD